LRKPNSGKEASLEISPGNWLWKPAPDRPAHGIESLQVDRQVNPSNNQREHVRRHADEATL
jgi:hypothetical protein